MEDNITDQKVWTSKQLYQAIISTAVCVFVVSMIYARFVFVETEVETIDKRYKKITDRIIFRLDVLEEPNSDK